ncbi:MAG: ferric reductase-like transmembrane domain-containing protein [Phycisphaerales bacterium]
MSATYRAVQWTGHKRLYDACVATAIVLFIVAYIAAVQLSTPPLEAPDAAVTFIRATGFCAYALLHVILLIGPACRLWRGALPLLYNRRHLGVMTFFVGLLHALAVLGYYHGFGEMNPLVSLLVNTARAEGLPFEYFGIGALLVMFLLAATSHDFWNANLGPVWWKRLHMLVYVAYFALVAHVGFGYLQGETGFTATLATGLGVVLVVGFHLIAGVREALREGSEGVARDGWLDAGPLGDIPDGRGTVICPKRGERIAVFNHGGKVVALSNVCAHQGGPLGEGKIIDGCVTCPWHGHQFRPEDGKSPPPFTDRVPTYEVRVEGDRVYVRTTAEKGGER